ncbi:probable receptor-like protein kinase At5g61350 [Prosopis cineraria]|uniref:probable receptor-like protein kinase At5g61350 n=1 Tax=Prosopis cineraria TaxID=364024 RepID=UPI00240ED1FB|nr:probable receptor-like protein kinase At5g61350 [Prosopis cineraria]
MAGGFTSAVVIHSHSSLLLFLPLFLLLLLLFSPSNATSITSLFSPPVNYLIDCGSSTQTLLQDGRTFRSDRDSSSLLSTDEDIQTSVDSINLNASSSVPPTSLPLFNSARIFTDESTYTFYISKMGRLWVRLYFFPLPHPSYNLTQAVFTVQTDRFVLLHDFSITDNTSFVFKEYLLNVSDSRFSLKFLPKKKSLAFINGIEVVTAPDPLILDTAISVFPPGNFHGIFNYALQVCYRVNVGGPPMAPNRDPLLRSWETDASYNVFPQGSQNVSVSTKIIKYPQNGEVTPLIAPSSVYSSAMVMKDPKVNQPNFNLSWRMNADQSFSYLIRLHFCDIVSQNLSQLYFNVYLNEMMGAASLDLSSETKALATAFYQDFVLNSSAITNGSILVQVGPANLQQGIPNAILNGFEVIKMSNMANSLDGFFSVDGKYKGPNANTLALKVAAAIGLGFSMTAMFLVAVICFRWRQRPHGWESKDSFSSWLLPIQSTHPGSLCSALSKSSSRRSSIFGSRKSRSGYSGYLTPTGIGRFFPFDELRKATNNFVEKAVIGVGGFGKVYLGTLEDGTKVAIKRGNPSSEQGINEFRTEIDMLSKLRHRHLVSLMGFCDENSEMILVYEYMANGPFRSHLYGSNLPPLSWKQRLEICIGSARGLHYLHTGAAQSIIHRDVKTTNILLDENLVAKVADFGLSKANPEKTHVSTAVKGSFGYLDPQYFRSQQLTEKSDVYSFGVVLMEVLCARPVLDPTLPREQVNLADWALQQHRRGMLYKIIDPRIADTIACGSLNKFVEAAEKCLEDNGADRPTMGDVLWNLEYALQLQEAVSKIDTNEDTTANSIALEQANESGEKGDHSGTQATEESDVTDVDSMMLSQIAHFEGR